MVVFHTVVMYGIFVIFYGDNISSKAFLQLTMLCVVVCAVESVAMGLYLLANRLITHEPCPKCSENKIGNITRIDSGLFDDGSAHNPLTIEFDEKGNMYMRRYNRRCRSCGHVYYVNEGGWPEGAMQGERKLAMTAEQRATDERLTQENLSRTRKQ